MQVQQDAPAQDPNAAPQQNMPFRQRMPAPQNIQALQNGAVQQNGNPQDLQPQNGGQAANQPGGVDGTQNSLNTIRQFLGSPGAQGQPPGANSGVRGGGVAGVASKAQGHSIKVVNDQIDYSLWEFYYDPSKDTKQLTPGGAGLNGAQQPGNNGRTNGFGNPNGFGNNNQNRGFNQNSNGTNDSGTNPQNSQTNTNSAPDNNSWNPPPPPI